MAFAKSNLFINWLLDIVRSPLNKNPTDSFSKYFKNTVGYFMSIGDSNDITNFLSALDKQNNKLSFSLKNKVVQYIAKSNNKELINIATAVYASNSDYDNLFELIKCLRENNIDNSYQVKIAYVYIKYDNLSLVDYFLSTIGISKVAVINNLLQEHRFVSVKDYLSVSSYSFSSYELNEICRSIGLLYQYSVNKHEWYNLFAVLVEKSYMFNDYHFNLLVPDWNTRNHFTDCCFSFSGFSNWISSPKLMFKYMSYLHSYFSFEYVDFENKILAHWTAPALNAFTKTVPFCSKRKFLEKLSEYKATQEMIDFINLNPEFKKLLPML